MQRFSSFVFDINSNSSCLLFCFTWMFHCIMFLLVVKLFSSFLPDATYFRRSGRWNPFLLCNIDIVNWRRNHIFPVFIFGQTCLWRHDISRYDQSEYCSQALSAKHSVCLHVSRAVSRQWPSDLRGIVWHWTLIGQSQIYFSPVGLIWLYFIRLWYWFRSLASGSFTCFFFTRLFALENLKWVSANS